MLGLLLGSHYKYEGGMEEDAQEQEYERRIT